MLSTSNIRLIVVAACSATAMASVAMAADGGRKLSATLTGAAEVPKPGDSDGAGTAAVTVNAGKMQVCYKLVASKIDTATGAHIHEGAEGMAGPVKITLKAPAAGNSSGCAQVTRDVAMAILKNPTNYYVNVHNAAFPGGALRGQLGK